MSNDETIAGEIIRLAEARGAAASFCPSEVARALSPEWRPLLGAVRRQAALLAAAGRIDILRKGKPVPAAEMRGVFRLRLRGGA